MLHPQIPSLCFVLLTLFLNLVSAATIATTLSDSPLVHLGKTRVIGATKKAFASQVDVEFFGGIPFGEPPVGNLRFEPPVAVTQLPPGSFDATEFGPSCFQLLPDQPDSSEDCLSINILRPTGLAAGAKLPVLAWIYGGGFYGGNSSLYDGSEIVATSIARGTPVIYASFNYRLGPFGFPQGSEARLRGLLNLGLKDQLLALEWIQKNIGAFGGDKSKVTVFGESAGSISIADLFLNSKLETLVRGAIFESGQAATTPVFSPTIPRRQLLWESFVKNVPGCEFLIGSEIAIPCLQNADAGALVAAWLNVTGRAKEAFPWVPVLDGPQGLIPDLPSKLYEQSRFSKIPFIAGTNLDEGTEFFFPSINYTDDVVRDILIANLTPPAVSMNVADRSVDRLLELYPDVPALGSPIGTGNDTFGLSPGFKRIAMLGNDILFQSQRRLWSQVASEAGVKNYGYLFTDPQRSDVDEAYVGQPAPYLGVEHGAEIGYVYGATQITPGASDSAKQLSRMMMDYWISFANSLTPNDGKGSPRPRWPEYTKENQVLLQLDGGNTRTIRDDYRKKQIGFINSNPPVFHH